MMHKRSLLAHIKILKLRINEFVFIHLSERFQIFHLNQFCKKCGRDSHIDWTVHDDIWNALPGKWGKEKYYGVLCLECFSELLPFEIHRKHFKYLNVGNYYPPEHYNCRCVLDPLDYIHSAQKGV